MPIVKKLIVPLVLVLMLTAVKGAFGQADEYETPEVTDRVARISLIRGDVQVRRSDSQDWESAVVNLPLVEGDEVTAGSGARLEVQFGAYTYARIDERSYLKITTLKDEGIALSLSEGSLIVRASEFNKQRSYFEIDAPRTTIALERAGMYRVDADGQNSTEVRVAAVDGGEARVYTDASGFTLRSGRSAQVFIDGANAGEWEMADASRFMDDFETWSLDRDAVIAKRLKDSYYDKYYDRDVYGAEDLGDYGEWIYTTKYGYVWRPYTSAISQYSDWSPYRYGHWRWVPPYGWTWVNDEPWGWATYHHGRWLWDDDHWVWTPYGYNRPRRSWWSPALVVIRVVNRNVCWYPLPYNYAYSNINYNYHHGRGGRGDRDDRHNPPGGGGTRPTPTPDAPRTGNPTNAERRRRMQTPPLSGVPATGVVMVGEDEFGRNRRTIRRAPPTIATEVLARKDDTVATPPILPPIEETRARGKIDVRVEPPVAVVFDRKVRTGAAERTTARPLDEELKKERILGSRPPVVINPEREGTRPQKQDDPRRTGAVERPARRLPPVADTPPIYSPPQKKEDRKLEQPQTETQPPVVTPRPRRQPPVFQPPVKTEAEPPPTKRDVPRSEPPEKRDTPRIEPPPRREPQPKPPEQLKRDEPKREEPKPVERPKPPTIVDRKKDGR